MNLKRIAFIAAGLLLPGIALAAEAATSGCCGCDFCPF